jgi:hypothetical protein
VFLNTFALIGVSAETTDKISFEEAERLSFEAVRRYFNMLSKGYQEVDVNVYNGYFLFKNLTGKVFDYPVEETNSNVAFEHPFDGINWSYHKVEKLAEPFTSVADLDNYVKEIYAGKALDDFKAKNLYVEKDGNLYVPADGDGGWADRGHRLLLCNDFVSNGEGKAIMNVVFGVYGGPAIDYADRGITALNTSYVKQRQLLIPINATVEFTKTADGWRVSGGSLLEMISDPSTIPNNWDYKPYAGDTPFTGDETAIILALLALSGTAIAVVPKRKRRI